MTSSTPRPETIERLNGAATQHCALLAAIQLDIFTSLKDGSLTVEQIADAIGVDPSRLTLLLDPLVAAGLLSADGNLFSNSSEANHFLVRGNPAYIGSVPRMGRPNYWGALLKTSDSIRAGAPQEKRDFSGMSPEDLVALYSIFHPEAVTGGRDLATKYDFSSYRNLLDVGGGTGGLAIAVTEAYPHLRATVADLPNVTPITERYLREAGASNRIDVVSADVTHESLGGTYDLAILSALIQVLSRDQAQKALHNIAAHMVPGASLFILGIVLDDSRTSPEWALFFNMRVINIYDQGEAYTEQEYRDWLADAGMVGFERHLQPDGTSIVIARRRD